jgi:iron complex transport system substrate-binding protein
MMQETKGDIIMTAKDAADLRIVSLIPSATEIVCALGFHDRLVGRSHECDFPAGLGGLPVLTEAKLDTSAPSGEIDKSVRRILERALSVYRVDAARLKGLAPTHVVTQTQCEVCAVSLPDVEAALSDWVGAQPHLVACAPMALDDIWTDIKRVAAALGAEAEGWALVERLRARMGAIEARAAALPRPRIACIEWIEPLMDAGNWVPELVAMAGGDNLFGEAGRHSGTLEWESLAAADPDVIVFMPCGFDIPRTHKELGPLVSSEPWQRLRAPRDGQVYLTDGNAFFNRPGPRVVESLEILAEILHPEQFRFAHERSGWVRLAT